jgi:hypothetical protein
MSLPAALVLLLSPETRSHPQTPQAVPSDPVAALSGVEENQTLLAWGLLTQPSSTGSTVCDAFGQASTAHYLERVVLALNQQQLCWLL